MAAVEFSTISDADLSAKRPHIRIGNVIFYLASQHIGIWPLHS